MTAAPLIVVTGASSGIGQALAVRFHRAGYRLALLTRRVDEVQAWAAQAGLAGLADTGEGGVTRCAVYCADVCDLTSLGHAARACVAAQGIPDVVLACAGISVGMDSAEFDDLGVMRATFETNVLGMAATFQPFLAAMTARGSGTLVGIASVAGIRGLPGHGAYCSSKAAVISYCESLRGELRGSGVRVVTLAPGFIDTPLTRHNPYRMPFLMTAPDFAERAFQAIRAGSSYRVIPWQMGAVAALLRWLPNRWFDRIFAGRPRKPRQSRQSHQPHQPGKPGSPPQA